MDYLCESLNAMFKSSMFSNSLKLGGVTLLHKKGRKELKEGYRSIVFFQLFQKLLKGQCSLKYLISLTMSSQNIIADFGKAIGLNIAI